MSKHIPNSRYFMALILGIFMIFGVFAAFGVMPSFWLGAGIGAVMNLFVTIADRHGCL